MRPIQALAACTLILLSLPAAMCKTDDAARVEIRTVEVIREVPRDCPGERPALPDPLDVPHGISWERLAKIALAKLAEFSGPGQYADEAEAIFDRCPLSGSEMPQD